MKTSRRDFLKHTAIAGTGIVLIPFNAFSIASEAARFLDRIGISTSITNNGILATAGYSFVEENVRGFLSLQKSESVFEQKLALLKDSKLPVEACNSFLPGNLKCVGPAPLHEEILKFGETAFRRAQMARCQNNCIWQRGSQGHTRWLFKGRSQEPIHFTVQTTCPCCKKV